MSRTELLFTTLGFASTILVLSGRELGFHLLILVIPFASLLPESSIRGVNLTTLVIYSALAAALLKPVNQERDDARLKVPILALISVTVASTFWSGLTVAGYPFAENLAGAKRWFDFMLLYFIFRRAASDSESIRRYIRTIFIGYCLVVLHVTKEFIVTDHARLYGINQSNELGAFLAGYWGLCVLMVLERRSLKRFLSGSIIGFFGLTTLLYTLSRGGYLAFACGLAFLSMYLNRKLLVTLAIFSACSFAAAGFGLLPDAAAKRVQSTFAVESDGSIELEDSAYSRVKLAQAAIGIIRDYPITGTGWGCLFIKGRGRLIEAGTDARHVIHNMYLQIFAQLGILGFIPFCLILWYSFVQGNRLYKRAPPGYQKYFSAVYLSCLCAFMVSNLFGNRMFDGQTIGYFWIMSAFVERLVALASLNGQIPLNETAEISDVSASDADVFAQSR